MAELTERAVTARVPTLASQPLTVVGRRHPVSVPPGTTLGDCLLAIQRTGTGDSVFVTDADGRLAGVLTERDIFGRLVGPDVAAGVDLDVPVEAFMTTSPRTLRLHQTVRDALELMQTGRVPQRARRRRRRGAWSGSSARSTSSSSSRSPSPRSCSTSHPDPTSAWSRPKADDDD